MAHFMRSFPSLTAAAAVLLGLILAGAPLTAFAESASHAERTAQIEQLLREGKAKEAEKAASAAVAEDKRLLGADDALTLSDRLLLARAQHAAGDPISAEQECLAVHPGRIGG